MTGLIVLLAARQGETSVFLDPHGDDHIVTRLYVGPDGTERESMLGRDTDQWDIAVARAKVGSAFL